MLPVKLEDLRAVPQMDGHTCGFCALSAIYKYYGLSPNALHLRELLGTDYQLPYNTPLRGKLEAVLNRYGLDLTKGTTPMDVFAVLYWHGFDTGWAAGPYASRRAKIHANLKAGHPVLTLAAGFSHWIVLTGMDNDGVWVADSAGCLDPKERRLSFRIRHEEVGELFNGFVFVRRKKKAAARDMKLLDFVREYADGTAFGLACLGKAVPAWIRRALPG